MPRGPTQKLRSRNTSKSSTTASGVIRALATYHQHGSLRISANRCWLLETDVSTIDSAPQTYTLADGGGMYLEIAPSGSRIWRMSYRQTNGRQNRLTFGT